MELACDWLSDTLTPGKVCICICQRIRELLDYIKASSFPTPPLPQNRGIEEAFLMPYYSALELIVKEDPNSTVMVLCFLLI